MRYEIRKEDFEIFINENYKSKAEFQKAMKISQSHLYGLLKGDIKLGDKVYERLKKECRKHNAEIQDLIRPKPLTIGESKIEMINITKDGALIANITADNVIIREGYKCEMVPY